MRKVNGILLGTILVVLAGAMMFIQARTDPGADKREEGPPTAPASLTAPTIGELRNQVKEGTGNLEGPAGTISPESRFREDRIPRNTLPSRADGKAQSPQTEEEWEFGRTTRKIAEGG
ncbi:MAG: hypothetical protein IH851_03400 [Armatimonadetes bacterium]|nr:hypothetical protein [Armatimonadota bacterium]